MQAEQKKRLVRLRIISDLTRQDGRETILCEHTGKPLDSYIPEEYKTAKWSVAHSSHGLILPEDWSIVDVSPGDEIVIIPSVGGFEIGSFVFGTAFLGAVKAGTIAWGATLSLWASVISVGYSIYSALTYKPPGTKSISPTFGWDFPRTTAAVDLPVPIVYGKSRLSGNVINLYMEQIDDNNIALNVAYALGEGTFHSIAGLTEDTDFPNPDAEGSEAEGAALLASIGDKLKLNDVPIDEIERAKVYVRLGTDDQTAIPKFENVHNLIPISAPDGKLLEQKTSWTYTTAATDIQEIRLYFRSPMLGRIGTKEHKAYIGVVIEVSPHGDDDWLRVYPSRGDSTAVALTQAVTAGDDHIHVASTSPFKSGGQNKWPKVATIAGISPDYVDDIFSYDDVSVPGAQITGVPAAGELAVGTHALPAKAVSATTLFGPEFRMTEKRKIVTIGPLDAGEYDVRITKASKDTNEGNNDFADLYLDVVDEIVYDEFCYPYTALIGISIVASKMLSGTAPPSLSVECEGRKVYVLPESGEEGVQYSQNPIWCMRDLILNNRFGLGDFVDASYLDPATLLPEAAYADELVLKEDGGTIQEARFEFNAIIDAYYPAADIVNQLCASFHCWPFWDGNSIRLVIDRPASVSQLFTMGNIVDRSFRESFRSLKATHNLVEIVFRNEENGYERDSRAVEEEEAFEADEPIRDTSIQAISITRESEAIRLGRYIIYQEKYGPRTISFGAATDAVAVLPGEVFEFAHDVPQWALVSGQVASYGVAVGQSYVTLYDNVELPGAEVYANVSAGQTSLVVSSAEDFDAGGGYGFFYDPVATGTGVDVFSYTGKAGNTLTGIPAAGDYALGAHTCSSGAPGTVLLGTVYLEVRTSDDSIETYGISGGELLNAVAGDYIWFLVGVTPAPVPADFNPFAIGYNDTEVHGNIITKPFRALSITRAEDSSVELVGTEYREEVYDDTGGVITELTYTNLPSPSDVSPVTNVAIASGGNIDADGTWRPYIMVGFTKPEDVHWDHALIYVAVILAEDYEEGVGPPDTEYDLNNSIRAMNSPVRIPGALYGFSAGDKVFIKIVSVNLNGAHEKLSDVAAEDITVLSQPYPPSDITFDGAKAEFTHRYSTIVWHPADLELAGNEQNKDFRYYEVRDEDANWGTDDEHLIYQGNDVKCIDWPATYTKTYYIKGRNLSGTWSENSDSIVLTNAAPSAPPTDSAYPIATPIEGGIEVTWNEVEEPDIKWYNVYCDTNVSPTTLVASIKGNRFLYRDTPGITYYAKITAVDWFREGAASDIVNAEAGYFSSTSTAFQIPMFTDLAFTDDDPGAGSISWVQCTVSYVDSGGTHINGTVVSGNTDKEYVYWDSVAPNQFTATNEQADFITDPDKWLIAVNENGTHSLRAAFRIVHGGMIQAETVETRHLTSGVASIGSITTHGSWSLGSVGAGDTEMEIASVAGMTDPGGGFDVTAYVHDPITGLDTFTYDDIVGGELQGIPAVGANALAAHSRGSMVTVEDVQHFEVSMARGEAAFFGDRGDGTIAELCTIGISDFGGDDTILYIGDGIAGNANRGIVAQSYSKPAIHGSSYSKVGVSGGTSTGTSAVSGTNQGLGGAISQYGVAGETNSTYEWSFGVAGFGDHGSGGGVWGSSDSGRGGYFSAGTAGTPLTARRNDTVADTIVHHISADQWGSGDASYDLAVPGRRWRIALDNSDEDKLKIAPTFNINSDTIFTWQTDGKVGFRSTTIPHGGVGVAGIAIDGPNLSDDGPHVQFTTDYDDYPIVQLLHIAHDTIHWYFDSYYDGIGNDASSDVGSNFRISKYGDLFVIGYNSGTAQGDTFAFKDGIVLNPSGGVGIGTDAIPHGAVGVAKLAIEGPDASILGPHVQFTTDNDDYPVMAFVPWQHDSMSIYLDCYFDGTDNRSSDAGSNFRFAKLSDKLHIQYDSGIAQGSVVTFNSGIVLTTLGGVGIGTDTIPHGGTGVAKFALEGPDNSIYGPHVQFTTDNDDYPLLQFLNISHDTIFIYFDSYWDGLSHDVSSDVGSNFRIAKLSDLLRFQYNSGSAQGVTFTFNDGIVLDADGGVGIGTSTIPHGGVGVAKFAIDGPNLSNVGPHIQITTAADDYPLMQFAFFSHDIILWYFDSYYSGANDASSDVGSNFRIAKLDDMLRFQYNSGTAQGASFAFSDGLIITANGYVGIGTTAPDQKLSIQDGQIIFQQTSANQFESGRIRFTESAGTNYLGAFVHYDGSANVFHIGVHATYDETPGNDVNAISVLRSNGYVGIGKANPATPLDVVGDVAISGDLTVAGGDITAGANSAIRGTLALWDGGGGNTPGYIRIHSPNGTAWYVFVEDDGTVKVHNAVPTQNSDGTVVGTQT